MTTETYGIETLKKAVHLAIAIPFQAAKTVKQKFQLFDILGFIDELKDLADVIKARKQIGVELKDLSPAEREQLIEYIKAEFDLPNDKLEFFIEKALSWADSTVSLIEEVKTLKK